MNKKDNDRENLPAEKDKKESKIKKTISSIRNWVDRHESENDVVFSEPLTAKPKVDERAPLVKGGIDMWFLLWAMLLVCLGAVMCYSASAVYAEQVEGVSPTQYLWDYIKFAVVACAVTVPFVIFRNRSAREK